MAGMLSIKLSELHDTRCPICFEVLKNTRLVKECLHRFCAECIERSLRLNLNECPTCRVHIASRRYLQPDPSFDALVSALYGDVARFEAEEEAAVARAAQRARTTGGFSSFEARLAAQRAAADLPPEVKARGRAKRPRWGDAYHDEEEDEEIASSSDEEEGARARGGAGGGRQAVVVPRPRAAYAAAHAAYAARTAEANDRGPYGPRGAAAPMRPPAAAGGPVRGVLPVPGPEPPMVHVEVRPVASNIPPWWLPLPPLPKSYWCVPATMTVSVLKNVLALQLALQQSAGGGGGGAGGTLPGGVQSLVVVEDGQAIADWQTCLTLRQRADAAGKKGLCLSYARLAQLPAMAAGGGVRMLSPVVGLGAPPPPSVPLGGQ